MSDAITRKDLTDLDKRQSQRLTEMEERLIESDERLGKRLTEFEERQARHMLEMEERLVKHIDHRLGQVEHKLVNTFHRWTRAMEIDPAYEHDPVGSNEQREATPERIGDLERWKGSQPSK